MDDHELAIYDGDGPISKALRSIPGWRMTSCCRSGSVCGMGRIQPMSHGGSTNLESKWETSMSKWVGEGKDWIQLMAQGPLPQGRCDAKNILIHNGSGGSAA